MSIQRILCPIDFSDPARRALEMAVDLAKRFGATLTVMHVYPPPGYVLPEGYVPAGPEVLAEVEQRTRESLMAWQREAQEAGAPKVEIATGVGPAASEIVQQAHLGGFDLVVMGTHGRTGFAHVVLGSTAEKVVRHARCPVLTVPVGREP
jgi:nucleotide-binding universal stress UspA family protein